VASQKGLKVGKVKKSWSSYQYPV